MPDVPDVPSGMELSLVLGRSRLRHTWRASFQVSPRRFVPSACFKSLFARRRLAGLGKVDTPELVLRRLIGLGCHAGK